MSESPGGAKGRRNVNSALMAPMQPDEKLSMVIGSSPVSRSELVKRLWAYIRKHGLQDQRRRMFINADENLRALFDGKDRVTMLEMTRLVSSHLLS